MARFCRHIILLFGAIGVLNVAFHYLFNYPRNDYKVAVDRFPVYLFGDSHAGALRASDSLKRICFNFSYGSDDLADITNKINFLTESRLVDSTSTILLEVDLHLFSSYRMQLNNNDISGLYLYEPQSLFNYYFPLMGEKRVLSPEFLFRGKRSVSTPQNAKLETRTDSIRFKNRFEQQYGFNFELLKYYYDALNGIKAKCEKENIRLIGIIFPVHPYYRQLLNESIDRPRLTNQVAQVFKQGCFYDFTDSLQDEKYFRDQDHLNKMGAKQFLMHINKIVESTDK